MIKLGGAELNLGNFPDGTLLLKMASEVFNTSEAVIEWHYENDRELVALIFLAKHLHAHDVPKIHLYMPYIPNARQDRVKSAEDVFTLKYFTEIINGLNFASVTVLDPHSNVSEALINHIKVESPKGYVEAVIKRIADEEGELPMMFYPDEGASKRYSGMVEHPYAFGIKKRDWKNGKILGLDAAGEVGEIKGKNILIVDDICSKGGTFYYSAKKLKELGAKNIYLYISHCENSILEGELIKSDLLKRIFTTDSILTATHPLIEVFNCGGMKDVRY